MQSLAVTASRR